ncbi:MAG: hypothetical protein ACI4MH_06385 [Candidatus Coproplasma sp.]
MSENYITVKDLDRLLNKLNATVSLNSDRGCVKVEEQLNLIISEDFSERKWELVGFETTLESASGEEKKTFEKFDALVGYLKSIGCCDGENFKLNRINGAYPTLESFDKKLEFDSIDMAGLLNKYVPVADSFSLTCRFNDGYDADHPFGLYRMDRADGERALEVLNKCLRDDAYSQYALLSDEEKGKLEPFDVIYGKICAKCRSFVAGRAEENRRSFCDTVSENSEWGDAPWVWHAFNNASFYERSKYIIEKSYNLPLTRDVCAPLDDEKFAVLKRNLIRYEITFSWHCTLSGMPHTVFYFALNDQTIAYLAQFEHDYQFEKLEDLVFYKGDKLLFSSCTHEGFHTDCSDK